MRAEVWITWSEARTSAEPITSDPSLCYCVTGKPLVSPSERRHVSNLWCVCETQPEELSECSEQIITVIRSHTFCSGRRANNGSVYPEHVECGLLKRRRNEI